MTEEQKTRLIAALEEINACMEVDMEVTVALFSQIIVTRDEKLLRAFTQHADAQKAVMASIREFLAVTQETLLDR